MKDCRVLRASIVGAGAIDVALGVALLVAPERVLTAVGIASAAEPPLLRALGAQTAGAGALGAVAGVRSPLVLALSATGRIVNGVALLGGRRSVRGGAILSALGVVEIVLGAIHLRHATPDRST